MNSKTLFLSFSLFICISFMSCQKQNERPDILITDIGNTLPFENGMLKLELLSNTTPMLIERLHFFDEQVGVCITFNGHIYKTRDKGATWERTFSSPSDDFYLKDLIFIDNKMGFAVGGSTGCSGTGCIVPDGLILKTNDAGNTWKIVKKIPKSQIPSITFSTNHILYAINLVFGGVGPTTAKTKIFKSIDFGQTWDSVSIINFYGERIATNNETVFITGGVGAGNIFRGINQAANWTSIKLDSIIYTTEIEFKNGVGYCLANKQSLYKTTNDGENWTKVFEDKYGSHRMALLSEKQCFLFGEGRILDDKGIVALGLSAYKHTTDAGKNWEEVEFKNIGFYATHFFNEKEAYISNRSKGLVKLTLK